MRNKVIIIGGGVAGLTAAHELVDRGFEVHLYERRMRLGGKSASITTERGFSGEHGFRFFPGWYRHLPDTMTRIPYKGKKVASNLVEARQNLLLSDESPPVVAALRFPRSLEDLKTLADAPGNANKLGLSVGDFMFFFGKLALFAATPEALRLQVFESQTWWEFMEADKRSPQFRAYLVDGVTRNTVAADPRQANAHTICLLALRTLTDTFQPGAPVDRVLNGPTSKVWIDPWVKHLKARGVQFHLDSELDSLVFDGEEKLGAVNIRRHDFRLRCLESRWRLLSAERVRRKPVPTDPEHARALAVLEHARALEVLNDEAAWELLRAGRSQVDWSDAAGALKQPTWSKLEELSEVGDPELGSELGELRTQLSELADKAQDESGPVDGDYFVFALPIEQMAYYVNRSQGLQRRAPLLRHLLPLSGHVEWMAGIQFYLTEKLDITAGHIDCLDSEWALTAISQAQFWSEEDVTEQGKGDWHNAAKTILSVDISSWNVKGSKFRKEAFSCTPAEIAEEVWHQLKEALNRNNQAPVLVDEYLMDYPSSKANRVVPDAAYYLDEEIVDRFDRKKQAFYKKFESVRFSSEAAAVRATDETDQKTLFAHGRRILFNSEPLFVNRANTWALRPTVKTPITNMFIAGDYVQTNANLATMEAANEAARVAVNHILVVSGSEQPQCRLWTLQPALDAVQSFARFFGVNLPRPKSSSMPGQMAVDALSGVAKLSGTLLARSLGQLIQRK